MTKVIHQATVVKEGGHIEVQSNEFAVGDEVDVIVLARTAATHRVKLSDMIGTGTGLFKSATEVDAYINEERDSWER